MEKDIEKILLEMNIMKTKETAKILFNKFKEEMRKSYNAEPEERMTFDQWFKKEYEN